MKFDRALKAKIRWNTPICRGDVKGVDTNFSSIDTERSFLNFTFRFCEWRAGLCFFSWNQFFGAFLGNISIFPKKIHVFFRIFVKVSQKKFYAFPESESSKKFFFSWIIDMSAILTLISTSAYLSAWNEFHIDRKYFDNLHIGRFRKILILVNLKHTIGVWS